MNAQDQMQNAVSQYTADVKNRSFPTDAQAFTMNADIIAQLRSEFKAK